MDEEYRKKAGKKASMVAVGSNCLLTALNLTVGFGWRKLCAFCRRAAYAVGCCHICHSICGIQDRSVASR